MVQETSKKEYQMPEMQRLLCSWTMDLAAFLRSKYNMDKKRALELAHLNRELLTRLGTGRVWFVYRKVSRAMSKAGPNSMPSSISRRTSSGMAIVGWVSFS